jgi:nucleoside-diphosphate-sugar epimerase
MISSSKLDNVVFVLGGAGFIGHHLARRLKQQGKYVIVFDIKNKCEYAAASNYCNEYVIENLAENPSYLSEFLERYRPLEIYQLAADMGGAGYIFTGDNDFNIMCNSAAINLNLLRLIEKHGLQKHTKVFYSSSACIYPKENQEDPNNPNCKEDSAYPANPDSEYGWEKLFSERLYLAAKRNIGLNIKIARLHNVYGPEGAWKGGKEKAPAALCRKVVEAVKHEGSRGYRDYCEIEVWGDGEQTRSFLYIEDCLEGIQALMASDKVGPYNIGSEEMVSINDLVDDLSVISDFDINIKHIDGPIGVRGRNSDNTIVRTEIGWEPKINLFSGLYKTYNWIKEQHEKTK